MKRIIPRTQKLGFTIVELLVIIVVIGILVGITVVSYGAITDRARHKTVEADAQGMSVALNKYKASNGVYPTSLSQLTDAPKSDSTFQYRYNATSNTYCVTASVTGASAYVQSGNSTAKEGGCPGHGVNGENPVANLTVNPSAETDCSWAGGYFGSPMTACPTTLGASGAVSGTKVFATTTNSTTSSQGMIYRVTASAKENQQYTCSMSFKGTPGSIIYFGGRPATTTDGYITEGLGNKVITLSASWQRVSITFTTPAATGILKVQSRLNAPASGITIQADALMCTEGATDYAFADGNTSGWMWNGTANLSDSIGPIVH